MGSVAASSPDSGVYTKCGNRWVLMATAYRNVLATTGLFFGAPQAASSPPTPAPVPADAPFTVIRRIDPPG
ncbi:MAG: hypothetical protein ACYDAQ_18270 [Mycobacteriales bacterium]